MEDYSITWKYLVEEMGRKYGISTTNAIHRPLSEIFELLYGIWDEYVDIKKAIYAQNRKEHI